MNHSFTYTPTKEVCCKAMEIEISNNTIKRVRFTGGCDGNLQGIASLLQGMEITTAITKLQGIKCKTKSTSCPDQLAKALSELLA
jgi:uncharacterized protein (TIGR03905 family)